MTPIVRIATALGIVAAVGGGIAGVQYLKGSDAVVRDVRASLDPVTLTLFYGGEKTELLKDPEVVDLLRKRWRITLDAQAVGSIAMATDPNLLAQKKDCRWPSSSNAADLYSKATGTNTRAQTIFNSPLVVYAWKPTADALAKAGVVTERDGIRYISDLPKLVGMVQQRTSWKSLGLPYWGPVKIYSTDPTKSNGGGLLAGLLATMMNNGETFDETKALDLAPKVAAYFRSLGQMDAKSSDAFDTFLTEGEGGRPLSVGYESQIAEYALQHPEALQILRDRIVTLYPEPTVWSSHPIVAETKKCDRLIDAMKDPDIQRIAWERHGFRSGLVGVTNDPKVLKIAGIPAVIEQVVPMPGAEAMAVVSAAIERKQP